MTRLKKTLLSLLLFLCACLLAVVGVFAPSKKSERVSANAEEGYALPISVVGGSIRLPADEEDVMGVRFLCEVQWYEEFGENFSAFDGMGVLLNLKTDGELSMDNHRAKVEYLTDGVLSAENKLNRGYVVDGQFVADSKSDNYYMIVYCYGIPAAQYHAEFSCVGYLQMGDQVVYSEPVTRSVAEVAFKAYQATDDESVKATLTEILTDEGYEHDMSVYVSDEEKHWLSCSLCGYYADNAATLGDAHTPDSSGICSVCGAGFESAVLLEGVESFTYTHSTTLNHALTMTDGKTLEYSTDQTGATYATETKGQETYTSIKDKYVENVIFTDEYGNPAPPSETSGIPAALVDEILWYYLIENGVEYDLSYHEESGVWVQGRLESEMSFEASKEAGLSIFRNAVNKFNRFAYDEETGTYKNAEPMSLELRETSSEGWEVIDRTEDMYFEFKIVNGTIEWMELKATFIDETNYTTGYMPLWTYLDGNLYGQKATERVTGTVSVRYFNINSTTLELPENIVLDETVTSYHCQHEHLAEWEKQEYFHMRKCNDCNRFVNYAMHDFKEGACVDCGYVCLHSEYSGVMNLGYNHAVFCDNCGNTVVEEHTFEEDYCTVCSQRVCAHENVSDLHQFGSSYHGYNCNDCGSMLRQPHSFENEICTVCYYEICHHEGEKTYRIMQDQHGFSCPDCGESVYEEHTFAEDICSVCGFNRECTHPETKLAATGEYAHGTVCATCGLTMDGEMGQHKFENGVCMDCGYICKHSGIGGWNSLGDVHEARCYTCDQTVREAHDFQNGQCQKCGVIDCDHENAEPIQRQNNEYHGFYCNDCSTTVRKPHAYVDDYCAVCDWTRCAHPNLGEADYDYDSRQHWILCSDCNSELRGEHEMEGDTCAVCGYEVCKHGNVASFTIVEERHAFFCPDCTEWIEEEHQFDGTVCTVCGYNTACAHEQYILTALDEYMHGNVCKDCGLVNESEATMHHAFKEGVCTECEYSCPHSNVDWNWTSDTEHEGYCSNCNKDFSGDHVAPEGGWEFGDQGHWQRCILCNNSMSQEPHEFESGVCKVCSYECTHYYDVGPTCRVCGEKCTHEWSEWTNGSETHHHRQCSRCNVTESVEHSNASKEWTVRLFDFHTMECEVCGGLFGHTSHSPDDETGICVECGFDTTCTHAAGNASYQSSFYSGSVEYSHVKYYDCCGVYIEEEHTFENGVCIHCGFECTHWKDCTPSDAGTHTVRCTNCQLTWTESCKNTWNKAFLSYHEVRCSDCQGVISSEAHTLDENGCCTACSYDSNCAHDSVSYQEVSDTQHEVICNYCGVMKERVDHTYQYETCECCWYRCTHDPNDYEVTCTPNGDTHTYQCAHCGMDWEGEHYDNDDAFDQWDETNHYDLCDECGAKINESAHNLNTEWGFCYDCKYQVGATN